MLFIEVKYNRFSSKKERREVLWL